MHAYIQSCLESIMINDEKLAWLKFDEFTCFTKLCSSKALSSLMFADVFARLYAVNVN